MSELYIVFGSETELLKDLFTKDNANFIRIYNKRVPEPLPNSTDVNTLEDFKKCFLEKFNSDKPSKIIFIGAAFLTQTKLLMQEKIEDLETMLDVNIMSYVKYCHFILPYMIKIKSGQFVYLSSFRSQTSSRGISIYSASKAFGEKFFEVLGKENAIFGIYSASIRMGYFDGRMTNLMDEQKIRSFKASIGNRKLGSKDDLVNCINYIIENKYTNGGVIDLTGGINFA